MTDTVDQMLEAAHGAPAAMMQVLLGYDYHGDSVLLVVEGNDDSIFYERVARDRSTDPNRGFDTVVAGNKDAVLGVYNLVDWCLFDQNRLLFFVDRDYSDYVESSQRIDAVNVYVTDGYSIENSLLNQQSAIKLAGRACTSNTLLTQEDKRVVIELYEESRSAVSSILMPITACQVLCLQHGCKYTANSFSVERYLVAGEGRVGPRDQATSDEAINSFLESVSGIEVDRSEVDSTLELIANRGSYEVSVRGKYRMRAFRIWLQSLKNATLPSGAVINPGVILNDLFTNAVAVAVAPQSLRDFFDRSLG